MQDTPLPCGPDDGTARLVHAVRPGGLDAFLAGLEPMQSGFLREAGFKAAAQELAFLPGADGIAAAVLGLGSDMSPYAFSALPFGLPAGLWRVAPTDIPRYAAVLGFCLGAYRYGAFKAARRESARLVTDADDGRALSVAAATRMARDLVNAPPNVLGPAELADATLDLAARFGASAQRIEGAALVEAYPTIAMVGAGSDRAPVVASFQWRGSAATDASPLISLCGKGVCFDTGGYDLKPSAGMLRMKKDMGGAACVLAMARILMEADLPIRLSVRIGCVENSVSGRAMRPSDVVRTRKGLTVEIGNTDAEGRLVLCDLLDEACAEQPALLLDCATLTGAARVALGPDLPAMFSTDDRWAELIAASGIQHHDPVWRLPLWDGYESWLDSNVADLNNVSARPMAGAVTAALFLRRFVTPGISYVHFDLYAWNDVTRPGRPEGGEAYAARAVCSAIELKLSLT